MTYERVEEGWASNLEEAHEQAVKRQEKQQMNRPFTRKREPSRRKTFQDFKAPLSGASFTSITNSSVTSTTACDSAVSPKPDARSSSNSGSSTSIASFSPGRGISNSISVVSAPGNDTEFYHRGHELDTDADIDEEASSEALSVQTSCDDRKLENGVNYNVADDLGSSIMLTMCLSSCLSCCSNKIWR